MRKYVWCLNISLQVVAGAVLVENRGGDAARVSVESLERRERQPIGPDAALFAAGFLAATVARPIPHTRIALRTAARRSHTLAAAACATCRIERRRNVESGGGPRLDRHRFNSFRIRCIRMFMGKCYEVSILLLYEYIHGARYDYEQTVTTRTPQQ